jgi:hypothetical protein
MQITNYGLPDLATCERVAAERGGICAELGMAAILREPTGACALSSSS